MKASAKKNYIQINEARYRKMDDATFLKAFEEEHENPIELRVDETLTSPKYLPFFEACLTAKQFEEIREDIVDGVAFFEQLLDEYPNLIAKLPLHELWRLYPEERLWLLIHHPEEADILRQTLEGNDVWATSLWKLRVQIQRGAAKLCPWETLTDSQKRYMSLRSATLKRIIEKQQAPKK